MNESGPAARSAEEWAAAAMGRGWLAEDVKIVADTIRSALAARDAEVRRVVRTYWEHRSLEDPDEDCPACAPLRALLSEGKPGKETK